MSAGCGVAFSVNFERAAGETRDTMHPGYSEPPQLADFDAAAGPTAGYRRCQRGADRHERHARSASPAASQAQPDGDRHRATRAPSGAPCTAESQLPANYIRGDAS